MSRLGMQRCLAEVRGAQLMQRLGRVSQFFGLVVESVGPDAFVGEVCEIHSRAHDRPVMAEVLGLKDGKVLLMPYDDLKGVSLGCQVVATGKAAYTPVGEALLGRVVDAFGAPLDGSPIKAQLEQYPLRPAPINPLERARVCAVLETGVRAIDCLFTLGRGQRVGIFAGSGVGKSTLLGMIARNTEADVNVITLVGERGREVREFIEDTLGTHMQKSVAVVATSDESPMLRKMAPLSAITIAEHFRDQGDNVLLIVDSVTRFAHAIREVATASGEPPIARGYPASVFTELPRLLERAGPGPEGTGTITAIISILVDGDNHNDPIADSTRGILDGHIVLQRSLAEEGRYPPIDPLASISRLARKAWTPDQEKLVSRLKALVHRYEETRDLRLIGGYRQGADPDLDIAVRQVPIIYEILKQTPGERPSADAFTDLATALKNASAGAVPVRGK